MATTTEQRSTVVGVFEDRQQADAAVNDLRQAGFREDQIGVAVRGAEGEKEATTARERHHIGRPGPPPGPWPGPASAGSSAWGSWPVSSPSSGR